MWGVQDKDFMPHSITNEVVADQLLRAKAGERNLLTSSRTLQDWYARRLAVQMGIETMNTKLKA